jgi:hypothetical protein
MRLVGVTSRGTDPSIETCDIGTVFTLAPAYLDMLRDVTGEDLGGGATDPTPPPPEPGEDPAEDPPPPPPPAGADAGAFVPPADPGAAPPPARGATGGCSCDVAPAADAAPTPSRMFALYFLVLVVRGVTRLRRR